MNILGLDPSLNSLGYFIFNTDDMKVIDYGVIANKSLEESEKLLKIYNSISTLFKAHCIDGVGIEEEFGGKNMKTLKKLSHVHGALLLSLSQHNVPFTYYSVMTIKSKVLGGIKTKKEDGTKKTGTEMKAEVAEKIFEVFGKENLIKPFNYDVTDAASIALCYKLMDGKVTVKPIKKRKSKRGDKP